MLIFTIRVDGSQDCYRYSNDVEQDPFHWVDLSHSIILFCSFHFLAWSQLKMELYLDDDMYYICGKLAAVDGDGYKHSTSPHTMAENFQGVTLGRAGLVSFTSAFLMLYC